ncbi:hypothetical protein HHE02_13690 [Helicobacter heilmannii]|uniref:Uncharacterized protein n=1 Tax=Helicobacter heilmannii TaxID=35817 RepID=A0A0K2XSI3_HELHE|nr:hypothetical protein [Helicobacter heilmannii]CCM11662.1 hypothetical protein BN341_19660 [Helicobacter heilmannii ASB1.4]CRF48061.1 hypothetical protein HHE02_13690 [Helicobacter heilmannii]CRF50081.1 hypothetical protein HHE03_17800 [Helicobacter heilmannii]CRI33802.1 hypothetical protein HHE01_14880 [Helicobacter heilmannii]BDQ27646.1 hypothetical protein ASB1_13220 [Helicobacter heilmannii]
MRIAKFRALVLWFVVAVALGVAGFLGYRVYLSKHRKPHTAYEEYSIHEPVRAHAPTLEQEQGLKEVFSQSLHEAHPIAGAVAKPPFIYPAFERKMGIEFLESTPVRKVLVKNLDNYKLFCLQEILKTKHIDFALDRKKSRATLIIYLPNATTRFLEDLKYYEIPYQLD